MLGHFLQGPAGGWDLNSLPGLKTIPILPRSPTQHLLSCIPCVPSWGHVSEPASPSPPHQKPPPITGDTSGTTSSPFTQNTGSNQSVLVLQWYLRRAWGQFRCLFLRWLAELGSRCQEAMLGSVLGPGPSRTGSHSPTPWSLQS